MIPLLQESNYQYNIIINSTQIDEINSSIFIGLCYNSVTKII